MSRVGKQPVAIPAGVQVETSTDRVRVKGPKGSLEFGIRPEVAVAIEGKSIVVTRKGDTRAARAYHGTARATINNMIHGVTQGYQKDLDIIGVGWNAAVAARTLVLNVGFCKPVVVEVPAGITASCPNNVSITITGADKQGVGQLAAKLRAARPPEPYKGKGVRYKGEYVKIKAGKSFGS